MAQMTLSTSLKAPAPVLVEATLRAAEELQQRLGRAVDCLSLVSKSSRAVSTAGLLLRNLK